MSEWYKIDAAWDANGYASDALLKLGETSEWCDLMDEVARMTHATAEEAYDGMAKALRCYLESLDGQDVTGAPERVTESGETLHDTREKLEADVRRKQREWSQSPCALDTNFHEVIGWLDRQAAITERECMERSTSERIGFDCAECAEGMGRELEARCRHLKERIAELKAKLDAEAQHAREAWQLWGEADARAEQLETERDEMAQRIQTLELEIAKRDKGIERLKRRRGELTEQLLAMAYRMAKDGR